MFQSLLIALLLDQALGEPRRAHPLVGFGRLAGWIEALSYQDSRARGVLALLLAVAPPVLLAALLAGTNWAGWTGVIILYLCLGLRSLGEHARPIARALEAGDLQAARAAVSRMVSRDTAALEQSQVAAAATESVLENGNDAVFGALFWFALAGPAGAVLYRLVNTLDAMWGYRNARYGQFGWAAARLDDVLNYVPARLTALSYALVGRTRLAIACWRRQAGAWDSPNAGPVMAAGAGALGVRLGGPAPYEGQWHDRPPLGEGEAPGPRQIRQALRLVNRAVVLWLAAALLLPRILSHA